jgi:hypothetical protein
MGIYDDAGRAWFQKMFDLPVLGEDNSLAFGSRGRIIRFITYYSSTGRAFSVSSPLLQRADILEDIYIW